MFHAMKQMGFFSQDEMGVLERRFGSEEKIADALGEYATRRTGAEAQSRIKAIFDRFLEFVKRVGSMLVGRGWTKAEDIFDSVVKGRPGKRASGSEGSTRFSAPPQGQSMFKAEPKDQTQIHAFKKWFGDSKVVDADGKPLVVYHGTARAFEKFRKSKRNYGNAFNRDGKIGFFFSGNTEAAEFFALS